MSVILMFNTAIWSIWSITKVFLSVVFIFTSLLIYSLKKAKHVRPITLFIVMTLSLIIVALFTNAHLHRLYFVIMGHDYKDDAIMLPLFAAHSILSLKNPYLANYLHSMLDRGDFGFLYQLVPYTHTPIEPGAFTPYKGFTPYIDPQGKYFLGGHRINYIGFFDYPPGTAIYQIPAQALKIPVGLWLTLSYTLMLLIVFIKTWRKGLERILIAIVVVSIAYFISVFVQTFIILDVAPYIVLVLLALTFSENPKVFGILLGLAAATMPQATLLALYMLIMAYSEFGYKYTRDALVSALPVFVGVLLPFLYPNPIEVIKRMYFPILATLPVGGISITAIIENFIFHVAWPSPLFKPLPYIAIVVTLMLYGFHYEKLRDVGLTLPILVIMFFSRASSYYMAFYPLIAFVAWLMITSEKEPVRPGILRDLRYLNGCIRDDFSKIAASLRVRRREG